MNLDHPIETHIITELIADMERYVGMIFKLNFKINVAESQCRDRKKKLISVHHALLELNLPPSMTSVGNNSSNSSVVSLVFSRVGN